MKAGIQLAVAFGRVLALTIGRQRSDRHVFRSGQHIDVAVEPASSGRVDDPATPRSAGGFEHRDRAAHVRFGVAPGILHRDADVGLGGEVEGELRLGSREHVADRGAVANVNFVQRRAPLSSLLEVRAAALRQVVDHGHTVATRRQRVDQMGADEAGTARNQAVHGAGRLELRSTVGVAPRPGNDAERAWWARTARDAVRARPQDDPGRAGGRPRPTRKGAMLAGPSDIRVVAKHSETAIGDASFGLRQRLKRNHGASITLEHLRFAIQA